jgi:hypothetical protein
LNAGATLTVPAWKAARSNALLIPALREFAAGLFLKEKSALLAGARGGPLEAAIQGERPCRQAPEKAAPERFMKD